MSAMDIRTQFSHTVSLLLGRHSAHDDELAIAVIQAQKTLLYRQLLSLAWLPIVSSTLMALSLLGAHPPLPVILWYVTYITIPGSLFFLFFRNRKAIRKSKSATHTKQDAPGQFLRNAEHITSVSGVFWGITAPLFGAYSEELLIFMSVVIICHACGFAQLVSAIPRLVFRFTSLTLIPMSLMLMMRPSMLLTTLGVLGFAVFLTIMLSSLTSYRQLRAIAHSEARARRAETLLRSSIDAMPDAFAVYDFDGKMMLENTNHKSWTLDYLVPYTSNGEQLSQTPEGKWIKHSWNLVPEIGTLMVHTDITIQKRREAQLIEAREQAQRATGAQSRFLSRISHELRTPLNSVLGFSELLTPIADKRTSWDTVKEYADYIHSSGQHLLSLVDDIIDYTSVGDDADLMSVRTVDLEDTLKRAVEIGRAKAGMTSEHKILMRLTPDLRYLRTDKRVLERIIAGIISNSIKFSAPDSKIAISASFTKDGKPMIAIRDFGCGMSPEQVKAAFTAFYQGEDSHQRASEGTGIGLALVKKLAGILDADVDIASKPGRGTVVMLTFNSESALTSPFADEQAIAVKRTA